MFTHKVKKSNSLANNTQQKFKAQLSNHNFETASGILRKTGSQLKQTKLSLCPKDNKLILSGFVEESTKKKPNHDFIRLPVINIQHKLICAQHRAADLTVKAEPRVALPTSPMLKPGRNLVSLVGRVNFCIKMQKAHPHISAIWNVYGKLLRIIEGKRREFTLLLRTDDQGPILPCIFYDFDDELKYVTNGCFVLVVGRFSGENQFKAFTVSQVSINEWQQNFTRLENVTSYILMQNNINN